MNDGIKLILKRVGIGVGMLLTFFIGAMIGVSGEVEEMNVLRQDLKAEQQSVSALEEKNSDLLGESAEMAGEIATLTKEGDEAVGKLADVEDREAEVDERKAAVDERTRKVEELEAAVTETEQRIEESTFGDGIYVVGEDVAPGEYRSEGGSFCYYAFKDGTGADAGIIDNNIVQGQTRVTLSEGDVFESSSCSDWTAVN